MKAMEIAPELVFSRVTGMRIDRLHLENFKRFDVKDLNFHPGFNLMVGENGCGKSSILEALAIAVGPYTRALNSGVLRELQAEDARLRAFVSGKMVHWETQLPCSIEISGEVSGHALEWGFGLNSVRSDGPDLRNLAKRILQDLQTGIAVKLPVIGYYSTGRLGSQDREQFTVTEAGPQSGKDSRLRGYQQMQAHVPVRNLVNWFARQAWISFQEQGLESAATRLVRSAVTQCIPGAKTLDFDAKLGEVILDFANAEAQPFSNLSDGQRSMLAMVADLAQRMTTLNPHLEDQALKETPGVVMIDELDLHLHPKWQRQVIEDLRTTFPKVQFFCTTHSPFLIQSLRSGEELCVLDGQPTAQLGNLPIAEIARGIQGVPETEVSERYAEMKGVARKYLEELATSPAVPEEKLASFKEHLSQELAPYADNPAFQAFLEMKRAAKLGG